MVTVNRLLLLAVAVVTVHVSLCQNYDDWIVTAHNIGDDITLNCSNYCEAAESNGCHPREPIPDEFNEIKSWMGPAPSLYVWDVGPNNTIPATQCPGCQILGDDGWQFKITGFDPTRHIGIYHCMLWNSATSTYYLVKWGVNMRGPYFEDLLEKYEPNIIIGMSAFGGFLVVAVTILLVYKFRWVPDEHDKQSSLVTTQNNYGTNDKIGMEPVKISSITDGMVNEGFTPDVNVEPPPQYNGVKAEVQVHNHFWAEDDAQPGTSGSSSGSESGSVRKREMPHPPTPHHTVTQGFDFEREETKF